MNAKKCDRCKDFFDVDKKAKQSYIIKHAYVGGPEVDLCPACQEALKLFMYNRELIDEKRDVRCSTKEK